MPALNRLHVTEWTNPHVVPLPTVAPGAMMSDLGALERDRHHDANGQVLFVRRGALRCAIEGGVWIVPPHSAMWIPGDAPYAVAVSGTADGCTVSIDPAIAAPLPRRCCALAVTPLLRELLVRAAHLPYRYADGSADARIVAVLLDELAAARIEDLHVPMPGDPRLREIVEAMIAAPAQRATVASYAERAGMSERTLLRLVHREMGMSFARWRQRLCIVRAIEALADGASIQQVAGDLGYDSVPSFVTMFRKTLGTAPGRYMAGRLSRVA